jgi:hypothetical protein
MAATAATVDALLEEMLRLSPNLDGHFSGPWGSCEAYELQVLLLLELRFFPGHREKLTELYVAFLSPLYPDLGSRPLSALQRVDLGRIARILTAFRGELLLESAPSREA